MSTNRQTKLTQATETPHISTATSLFSSFISGLFRPESGSQNKTNNGSKTNIDSTAVTTLSTHSLASVLPNCMSIQEVNDIVKGYLAHDIQISLPSIKSFIWSHKERNLYQKAFAIARDYVLMARSPDSLENQVIENPEVLLPQIRITIELDGDNHTFQGTLEQLAIINGDQTRTSSVGVVMHEGNAERLRNLRRRFLPETLSLALDQARLAISNVDEDQKARAAKDNVLNAAFKAILKNNNPEEARNIIKNYVKATKPTVITDNSYFLNLLQFFVRGLEVLLKEGKELKDQWYGDQAYQYFIALGMILRPLPKVIRKMLKMGIDKPLDRSIDVSDSAFIRLDSMSEVGVNCSYNDSGPVRVLPDKRVGLVQAGPGGIVAVFLKLIADVKSAEQVLLVYTHYTSRCEL